jgi:hypothetical protein
MAKRFRLRFTFWLDVQKPDEAELAETIDVLKQERTFASTIRDGIRLICDLRAGRVDMLLELFPWVRESLQSTPTAPVEKGLQEQIARLEALLIAQGNVPIQSAAERPAAQATQEGRAALEVTASKASAETVAKNFLTSMKSLASGFFD